MLLEVEQVTHVYGNGLRALDEVSLSIPKGVFGLLGPNGAGKTTLMQDIATLQRPTSGHIRLNGADIVEAPEALRGRLGLLPQEFGVYPRVSALEMLDHLAVLKGIAEKALRQEIVESLLHEVNLWDVRHRRLSAFSGGMRQRFGVAQALIGSPELIIVDEPTAGLDPEERRRFLDLLASRAETAVVILSTHIVEDVEDLCTRMAIIAQGRVLVEGVTQDLLGQVRGSIWSKLVDRAEAKALAERFETISSRRYEGKTRVRILASERPDDSFAPEPVGVEDIYFRALAGDRRVASP